MASRKRRAPAGGFGGRVPLGRSRLARSPTPQQRILNSYYRLQSARIRSITSRMKPLPPNATPQQRERALRQLFNLVRVGGTLGISYQAGSGRASRGPDDALRRRQADCDELCMIFIAAARQLNIPLTGVSMGVIQFNTGRPGTSATEGHAMLFVRGPGGNQVFDFTHQSPQKVSNFSQRTIQALYHGNRLTNGPGTAGYPVISIASMRVLNTPAEMAAVQLLQRADHHVGLATRARGSRTRLREYDRARRYVEQAITLGSANRQVTSLIAQAALSVFDGYHSMGNAAYNAAARARGATRRSRQTSAITYYTRAVQFYSRAASLSRSRASELHDIYESRGLTYQNVGNNAAALSDYDQMIMLQPNGWSGYRKRISVLITMAQSAAKSRSRMGRVRGYILAAEKTGRTALQRIPRSASMANQRAAIQSSLGQLQALMRRRGWAPLP